MTDTITSTETTYRAGVDALRQGDLRTAAAARDDLGRAFALQNILARIATLGDE